VEFVFSALNLLVALGDVLNIQITLHSIAACHGGKRMQKLFKICVVATSLINFALVRADQQAAFDAMAEYLMFQEFESRITVPQQIDKSVFESVTFVDARDEEQFKAGTISRAVHIEWRQVLDRIDEIPADKKVILFCNTGSLSSQATFALRVAGHDHVVVLQSGYMGW
jgi:rhodanese-related sulfurtransferase